MPELTANSTNHAANHPSIILIIFFYLKQFHNTHSSIFRVAPPHLTSLYTELLFLITSKLSSITEQARPPVRKAVITDAQLVIRHGIRGQIPPFFRLPLPPKCSCLPRPQSILKPPPASGKSERPSRRKASARWHTPLVGVGLLKFLDRLLEALASLTKE